MNKYLDNNTVHCELAYSKTLVSTIEPDIFMSRAICHELGKTRHFFLFIF